MDLASEETSATELPVGVPNTETQPPRVFAVDTGSNVGGRRCRGERGHPPWDERGHPL
jgi:hypothetical protein